MFKIVMNGAMGKMGQAILECALKDPDIEIAGVIEHKQHPFINAPLIIPSGIQKFNLMLADHLKITDGKSVLIDFTTPESCMNILKSAEKQNVPMVIGTTGLSKEQEKKIEKAAKKIPVVYAPNMSVGVNLLFKLVQIASNVLSQNYDIEIWETHHRFKKDAPSGTAKKLAQIIADNLGLDYEKATKHGRVGITGERPEKEIGMHCLRAGDIVGEHTVLFSTLGERIELTHRAHSRATFALGAIAAAKFASKAKPKLYSMLEVLGFDAD